MSTNLKNYNMKILKKVFISAITIIMTTSLYSQSQLNISESSLKWEGKKITGSGHYGSMNFKESSVVVENGNIISGEFLVDMSSISCDDLSGKGKSGLEGHLKSEDFFDVKNFNTAKLVISSVNNETAKGLLTIKNITHPVDFRLTKDKSNYNAELVFDRSKYDVKYASGNFFENLGDKLILDEIKINVQLKLK